MKTATQTENSILPVSDPRTKLLAAKIKKEGARPEALIEILHAAQNAYGYLPMKVLAYISRSLKLPPSRVYATVSFYHLFSLQSKGEHSCIVCTGTACYVKGAGEIVKTLAETYGIHPGQTTPDGRLTLGTARCLGNCSLAPLLVVDDTLLGRETADGIAARVAAALRGGDPGGEATS